MESRITLTDDVSTLPLDELRTYAQSLDTEAHRLYRQLRDMHTQIAYDAMNPLVPFIDHTVEPLEHQSEASLRKWINGIRPHMIAAREHIRSQSTTEPASQADLQRLLDGLRKM